MTFTTVSFTPFWRRSLASKLAIYGCLAGKKFQCEKRGRHPDLSPLVSGRTEQFMRCGRRASRYAPGFWMYSVRARCFTTKLSRWQSGNCHRTGPERPLCACIKMHAFVVSDLQ